MKRKAALLSSRTFALSLATLFAVQAIGQTQPASNTEPNKSSPIPMDQLGTVAGKQYHGDGLSVSATPDGARLRCAFQRLEGHVTHEGLWLSSTADTASGERFRVMAVEVGRADDLGFADRFWSVAVPGHSDASIADAHEQTTPSLLSTFLRPGTGALRETGVVSVAENVARFIRDGLTEEYTVSVDGVRQDFIVEQRPGGEGELRVELDVTGAKVEPLVNGARPVRYPAGGTATEPQDQLSHGVRLVLDGSGRKLAYNRLRVVDATGRELPARMAVAAGVSPAVEGGILPPGRGARRTEASGFHSDPFARSGISAGLEAPALRQAETPAATQLVVLVDDAAAIYPVRIDPTFSDADWVNFGVLSGANNTVRAAVVDESGNLYIGGDFTMVADNVANRIAKWDGSGWSTLGTGFAGINDSIYALLVSGSNIFAGGGFKTAGGIPATNIAKWDGIAWSALGSGMNSVVFALTMFGTNLYAGGDFSSADGVPAHSIAKWDGAVWTGLGSGMNGIVWTLAASELHLYAGGEFSIAGGNYAPAIARWNGSEWSALGSGMNSIVRTLAVSETYLYAGGYFSRAGGIGTGTIAKWNGSVWSGLGSGLGGTVRALAVSGTDLYAGGDFRFGRDDVEPDCQMGRKRLVSLGFRDQ